MMEVESSYSDFTSCDRPDGPPQRGPRHPGRLRGQGQAEVRTSDKEASSQPESSDGTTSS
ncbi:hypothetical protein FD755_015590 [Muntiacus reevesi]|uniref:Uncharacterized protein n=1 Tax=Muntiacus reevesi TaxID=9886 RepID=A0A5N3XIC4_MUNRE|nr:hypothetical protein FD755_015590 [Muntiacus reevesi]